MSPETRFVPARRRAILALIGMAAAAAGCGDDDEGATEPVDEGAQAEDTLRQAFGGADVVRDADAIREEPLADYAELVGEIDGTDAYVAIVGFTSEDGDPVAIGYACDGKRIAEVLAGSGGSDLELQSEAGAALTAEIGDGTATGTFTTRDGRSFDFTAEEVDPEGTAGVFFTNRRVDDGFVGDYGGWIVLPDGSQRGSIRMGNVVLSGGRLDPQSGAVSISSGSVLAGQVDAFRSLSPD